MNDNDRKQEVVDTYICGDDHNGGGVDGGDDGHPLIAWQKYKMTGRDRSPCGKSECELHVGALQSTARVLQGH